MLTLEGYPTGGAEEVARRLVALAEDGAQHPPVRRAALTATASIQQDPDTGHPDRRNRRAIAEALYSYVLGQVAYVPDPHGVEQIQSAEVTMEAGTGDCDDMSVLSSALLGSLGIPTRLVMIGMDADRPDAFTHIYVEFQGRGGKWIPFDPVIEVGVGIAVPDEAVTTRRLYPVGPSAEGGPLALATLSGAHLAGINFEQGALIQTDRISLRLLQSESLSDEQRAVAFQLRRDADFFDWRDSRDVVVLLRDASGARVTHEIVSVEESWPWEGLYLEGRGRLLLPVGFDFFQPVRVEVYDTTDLDAINEDLLMGRSVPVNLSEETPYFEPPPTWWDEAADVAGDAADTVNRFLTVATVGAVGFAAFAAWPYVQPLFDSEDDRQ